MKYLISFFLVTAGIFIGSYAQAVDCQCPCPNAIPDTEECRQICGCASPSTN